MFKQDGSYSVYKHFLKKGSTVKMVLKGNYRYDIKKHFSQKSLLFVSINPFLF